MESEKHSICIMYIYKNKNKKYELLNGQFKCQGCNRSYSCRTSIYKHVNSGKCGTVKQVHRCYQCDKIFPYKSVLERHLQKGHGIYTNRTLASSNSNCASSASSSTSNCSSGSRNSLVSSNSEELCIEFMPQLADIPLLNSTSDSSVLKDLSLSKSDERSQAENVCGSEQHSILSYFPPELRVPEFVDEEGTNAPPPPH